MSAGAANVDAELHSTAALSSLNTSHSIGRVGSRLPEDSRCLVTRPFNATVGFEELASIVGIPSKSLHRMLAPRGNPTTESFFAIMQALQNRTRVRLRVVAKSA
jgi:hypothetical protein